MASGGWSNGRVAAAVLSVATVLGSGWGYWGYTMHQVRMEHANAYERRLAQKLAWKDTATLTAFQPCNVVEPRRPQNAKFYTALNPWYKHE